MNKTKIDLNAVGFGKFAQKVSDLDGNDTKPTEEVVPAVTETNDEPDGESKVPYSRFKKFHDAAKEAQDEAAYWKEQAERRREPEQRTVAYDDTLPAQWVNLYGNDDKAKEAWQLQKQFNAEIRAEAKREALEAVRSERYEELQRTEDNVEQLDDNFEDLEAYVGHRLTDAQQSAVLDIVDEYTPKDRNGNYAGDILPFDKAWEIYELKQNASKTQRSNSRDNVAALTGSQTQGDPSNTAEQDKNFNPLDWNAWKKRI